MNKFRMAGNLRLESVVGFGGDVPAGLIAHPDGVHIIYPLGSTIIVKNTVTNRQTFLQGHTNKVSCISLSRDGSLIASGQQTYMGFKADAIVWSFQAAMESMERNVEGGFVEEMKGGEPVELVYRLQLHKVKIQAVAFSPDGNYLATLGGQDDNNLVIWDVASGDAICGTPAASDTTLTVQFYNQRSDMLITGGNYNLRVWQLDRANRKLHPTDVVLGQLRRVIQCLVMAPDDSVAYCGTLTGDLLQVSIASISPRMMRASPQRFSQGIRSVGIVDGNIYVGNGDGSLHLLDNRNLRSARSTDLMGAVTSMALQADGSTLICGTNQSNVYYVTPGDLTMELRSSCHFTRINDVCFPNTFSKIFVTCSAHDIRVWDTKKRQELLRIQVPNLMCNCITVMPNGSAILSGWDDGKIRAFYPESGKLMFVINDAHRDGVTAISVTSDNSKIISGGQDGRVRVWVKRGVWKMQASMKEHKAPVSCIRTRANGEECVSASEDGSCIVWDMERYSRNNAMFASTLFRGILYHPDESQLLTCGSDRKLTYWDTYDANAIRIIDGSDNEINALDIEPDGVLFVSAGEDRTVKVWHYDDGDCVASGEGHSGGINALRISPDKKNIVSVGSEGAIFVWSMPSAEERR